MEPEVINYAHLVNLDPFF